MCLLLKDGHSNSACRVPILRGIAEQSVSNVFELILSHTMYQVAGKSGLHMKWRAFIIIARQIDLNSKGLSPWQVPGIFQCLPRSFLLPEITLFRGMKNLPVRTRLVSCLSLVY